MSLLVIPYPAIDPVAFEIGPVAVRWYGLAYMVGLLFAWIYVRALLRTPALWRGPAPITPEQSDDLLLMITVGVVVGGRLGSVLFYEPSYYLSNPEKIFAIWEGGMAFHGGLLGVILAVYIFSRWRRVSMLSIADLACASVPVGIMLGRIANFINGELYGRITDVPWAMVFPAGGPFPRHPSQLYEAFLEGLLLFAVGRYLTHRRHALMRPGLVTGVFFAGYGIARSIGEQFRLPDASHPLSTAYTTPGMVYSLPMIAIGIYLIWRASRPRTAAA